MALFVTPEQRYQNLNWQTPVDGKKLGCFESSKTRKIASEIFATLGISSLTAGAYLATQTVVAIAAFQVLGAVAAVSLLFALVFKLLPPSLNDPINAQKALQDVRKMVEENRPYSEILKKHPKIAEFASQETIQAILSKKIAESNSHHEFMQREGLTLATHPQLDDFNKALKALKANMPNLAVALGTPAAIQSLIYQTRIGLLAINNQHANTWLNRLNNNEKNKLYQAVMAREVNELQQGRQTLHQFIDRNGVDSLQFIADKTAVAHAFKKLDAQNMIGIDHGLGRQLFGAPFDQALTAYDQHLQHLKQEEQEALRGIKEEQDKIAATLQDQERLTLLKKEIAQLNSTEGTLQSQISLYRTQLQKLETQKQQLEAEISRCEKPSTDSLSQKIANINSLIQKEKSSLAEINKKINTLKSSLDNFDRIIFSNIQNTQRNIEKTKTAISDLAREIALMETRSKAIDDRLEKLNLQINDLQVKAQQDNSVLNNLMNGMLNWIGASDLAQATEEQQRLAQLKQHLENLKQSKITKEQDLHRLENQLSLFQNGEMINNEKLKLQGQIESQQQLSKQTQERLQQFQKYSDLLQNLQNTQQQISALQRGHTTLKAQLEELRKRKTSFQLELQPLQIKVNNTIQPLSDSLLKKEKEIKDRTRQAELNAQQLLHTAFQNLQVL